MKKRDIFGGNVSSPGEFLFIYIIIGAFIVGFLAFVVCDMLFRVRTEGNTDKREVTIASCTEKDGDLVLTCDDNMRYVLYGEPDTETVKAVKRIYSEGKAVTVYTETAASKKNEEYYVIMALRDADTYILTFDETNSQYRKWHKPVIIIFSVMLLLWGAVVAGSIIVGRHPYKFDKRIVRLFFRDGYIKD